MPICRSELANVSQAELAQVRAKFNFPEITRLVEFIAASKRGICRHHGASQAEEEE